MPLTPGDIGSVLRAELAALFKSRTCDEWERLLGDKASCVAAVYSAKEALNHVQVRARELVEFDAGKPAFRLPLRFYWAQSSTGGSPRLGADTVRFCAQQA